MKGSNSGYKFKMKSLFELSVFFADFSIQNKNKAGIAKGAKDTQRALRFFLPAADYCYEFITRLYKNY
jgi:hypothetical protein